MTEVVPFQPRPSAPPPRQFVARSGSTEDVIEVDEIADDPPPDSRTSGEQWDKVAGLFLRLLYNEAFRETGRVGAPLPTEPAPRRANDQGHSLAGPAPSSNAAAIDEPIASSNLLVALLRGPSGWYFFINYRCRRAVVITVVLLLLVALGKFSEAADFIVNFFSH
jgi:hypothetical protein